MASRSKASGAAAWLAIVGAVALVGGALWLAVRHRPAPATRALAASTSTWFPEPAYLLQHASDLHLSVSQKRHVEVADREWSLKKAAFDVQLKTYNSDTEEALAALRAHQAISADRAKIVAAFDSARSRAWSEATKSLTSSQVAVLDKLREKDEHPKMAFNMYRNDSWTANSVVALNDTPMLELQSTDCAKGQERMPTHKLWLDIRLGVKTTRNGLQLIPTTPITIKPEFLPLSKGHPEGRLIGPGQGLP